MGEEGHRTSSDDVVRLWSNGRDFIIIVNFIIRTLIFAIIFNRLFSLQTYKHPEWKGPYLGPKPSEECKRDFTEEQLRAGEGLIGLQAGSNKGATQAGQSIGATRKILLGK